MKVLVIDDDNMLRKMLHKTIAAANFEVISAATGKEGMEKFVTNVPDIVITDILLPDITGIEIIMILRKLYAKVKIIAITGGGKVGTEPYLELVNTLGADKTYEKPIDRQQLVLDLLEMEQALKTERTV